MIREKHRVAFKVSVQLASDDRSVNEETAKRGNRETKRNVHNVADIEYLHKRTIKHSDQIFWLAAVYCKPLNR